MDKQIPYTAVAGVAALGMAETAYLTLVRPYAAPAMRTEEKQAYLLYSNSTSARRAHRISCAGALADSSSTGGFPRGLRILLSLITVRVRTRVSPRRPSSLAQHQSVRSPAARQCFKAATQSSSACRYRCSASWPTQQLQRWQQRRRVKSQRTRRPSTQRLCQGRASWQA